MDSVGGVVEKVDLEPWMHMIADLSSEKFKSAPKPVQC